MPETPTQPAERSPEPAAALRVLASGSRGNCSVLVARSSPRRVTLIDAGLSPARTRRLLADAGIEPHEVDDILFTHLDTDHCHPGWPSALRSSRWHATVRVLDRHRGRAERMGLLCAPAEIFDAEGLGLGPVGVHPIVMAHDSLGVAAFRFEISAPEGVGELGFATDLGRVTPRLIEHMRSVGVLAIESNYCPRMQLASARPGFLKRRIMGGSGHLSNEEAARAVAAIAPRHHAVYLHLSRECNRPALVACLHDETHAGAELARTISGQYEPTGWVRVPAGQGVPRATPEPPMVTGCLFSQGGHASGSVA